MLTVDHVNRKESCLLLKENRDTKVIASMSSRVENYDLQFGMGSYYWENPGKILSVWKVECKSRSINLI